MKAQKILFPLKFDSLLCLQDFMMKNDVFWKTKFLVFDRWLVVDHWRTGKLDCDNNFVTMTTTPVYLYYIQIIYHNLFTKPNML